MAFDINKIREDFPILSTRINGKNLIYFDNAATTQKPKVMIDALVEYYSKYNANIHRGVHTLSQKATKKFESTRSFIAKLYGAKETEVIFTKNDTESLNLIAYTLGKELVKSNPNANIVITDAEHHSNIVPWQNLLKDVVAKITVSDKLRYLPFNETGELEIEKLSELIDSDTVIFAFTLASNTFGLIYDLELIVAEVRKRNPNTIIIVDAAQYVPHAKFDFYKLNVDFITFSAHKLCGPTGVGILMGKEKLLQEMPPFLSGGDMIKEVDWNNTTFNDLPYKFEAGTPNIADVIAFKASLEYLENIGWENIQAQENKLANRLLSELDKLEFVEIYGKSSIFNLQSSIQNNPQSSIINYQSSKLPLVSFNIKGIHAHDIGTLLDEDGIAVRTGHHCTQLIMRKLQIPASVRASLYFYNTEEEIEIFINSLNKSYKVFN